MAITRDLRCGDCGGVFPWLFMSDDDGPQHCPKCGAGFDGERPPTRLVSAPAIREKAITKSVDQTYKQMEEGAHFRAQAAREMGVDAEAAKGLEITDLKSNLKYGEIAAPEVNNTVSQHMAAINARQPGSVGFRSNGGSDLAAAAHTGADAYSGAKAQNKLREVHSRFGGPTSSVPALETQQPGYRKRV